MGKLGIIKEIFELFILKRKLAEQRKETWYKDQYDHPHEEDYSHKTLKQWFKEESIAYVGSLPKYNGSDVSFNLYMLTKMGSQGGLFNFIGRKN